MHNEATAYFHKFLLKPSVVEPCDLIERQIFDANNISLCSEPAEEEVRRAMFFIPKDSSPRPDGFGSKFYVLLGHSEGRFLVGSKRFL